jgi:hypothetical protein
MAQVVQRLPSKLKAVSSNSRTKKMQITTVISSKGWEKNIPGINLKSRDMKLMA